MKPSPLVSIIIPTYNRAQLIGETLDSILAQTYQNWECIVVDDGSTDGTDKLMAEYIAKDSRFQYHHRPKDRLPGGNAARNYGFEMSRGEYINFLDSDDIFHYQALETKLSLAIVNNADIVISTHTRCLEKLSSKITKSDVFTSNTFDLDFILSRNSILIGEPMIKRQILDIVRFDENLVRSQDYDFLLRLFRQRLKYCRINAVLYYYRRNQISISNKASKGKAQESRTQLNIIKKYLEEYKGNITIEKEYYRGVRKMYKSLMKKKRIDRILESFNFYRKSFKLNFIEFTFYFIINLFFGVGYDRMRKNIK